MTQNILGNKQLFLKKLNKNKAIAIAVTVVAVALNALFCILRTDDNHSLMLLLNILVDALCGCFLVAFVSFTIAPQSKLLKLYESKKSLLRGQIVEISTETTHVQAFDCLTVWVGESRRALFLPTDGQIELSAGEVVTFGVTANVIVEVTV